MNDEPEQLDDAEIDLTDFVRRIEEQEHDIGLEYAGRDKGSNRAARRSYEKTIKRVTRRPVASLQLRHPILETLTPSGAKRLKRRRAKNKVAKQSRKKNRS